MIPKVHSQEESTFYWANKNMLLRKPSADEPASQASKRSSSYKSPSSSSYRKRSAGKFKYILTHSDPLAFLEFAK